MLPVLFFAGTASSLELRSAVFENGGGLPARYTGLEDDVSPGLNWSGAPQGTQSFVLIMDDPDAPMGTWVHWVIYDIPKSASGLEADVAKKSILDNGTRQGMNSFRETGYGGPYPPPGPAHRYFFKLYAVDIVLTLPPGAGKDAVLQAMQGHVLAEARLTARFGRAK